jgi:hypothetical protein
MAESWVPATLTLIPPGDEADTTDVAEAESAAALTVPRIVAVPEGAAGLPPPQANDRKPMIATSTAKENHARIFIKNLHRRVDHFS